MEPDRTNASQRPVAPPPLPLPAQPIGYHGGSMITPSQTSDPSSNTVQRVFDTVIGPNVRFRDNMIQLVCVIIGAVGGVAGGYAFARNPDDRPMYMAGGAIGGLIVALIISGGVIGVIRFTQAARRR